jgi:hypothetical protein
VGEFIKCALAQLGAIYKQLEGAPVEGFLYVKGDYIIPPHVTFLDVEQTKQAKVRDQILTLAPGTYLGA